MLGVLLVAIVGLRVEVLKLGSRVGREIQQENALQSGDQALRARVSELSGNQRIERLAAGMGMVMPGPMDIHLVHPAGTRQVARAIQDIHSPAADTFLTGLVTERQTDAHDTIAAANTSAVGAQTTAGPGAALSSGTSNPSGTVTSTGTGTGTGTATAGATSGVSTTDGSTGAASANSTASATQPSTATGATGTSGIAPADTTAAATADPTGTAGPTTGSSDTAAGTASAQDGASGSTSGGTGLAG